jgi:hypothetical protein
MNSTITAFLLAATATAQSVCLHTPANPHPWANIQVAPASLTWTVGVCNGCCAPFIDCHIPPPGIKLEGGQVGTSLSAYSWDERIPQSSPCSWDAPLCCMSTAANVWAIVGFNFISTYPSPIYVFPPTTGTDVPIMLWVDGTPFLTSVVGNYHTISLSIPNNPTYIGTSVYVQFVRSFNFLGVDRWQSSACNLTSIWQ